MLVYTYPCRQFDRPTTRKQTKSRFHEHFDVDVDTDLQETPTSVEITALLLEYQILENDGNWVAVDEITSRVEEHELKCNTFGATTDKVNFRASVATGKTSRVNAVAHTSLLLTLTQKVSLTLNLL